MTIIDKVIAAVTPSESDAQRARARGQALELARRSPWLGMVLRHHTAVEDAFANLISAADPAARRHALRWLCTLLTGHAIAEEAVLYPAMALGDQKLHATAAFTEQSGTKIFLAALQTMDPASDDFLAKVEHVRDSVAHHVYEEECQWFPALARYGDAALQAHLAARYAQEFERYMGPDDAP